MAQAWAAKPGTSQLAGLYPKLGGKQLWAMEGMTLLPGIDDRAKVGRPTCTGCAKPHHAGIPATVLNRELGEWHGLVAEVRANERVACQHEQYGTQVNFTER